MKMKKRLLSIALAGVMTAGCLTGCGSSGGDTAAGGDSGSGSSSGGDYKISVILKTTSAEYWQYVKAGAEAYGEENGVSIEVKGPTSETAYDRARSAADPQGDPRGCGCCPEGDGKEG